MALLNKTYDLKTAAAMFGMGHITFYKILRGECETTTLTPGWIHAGTYSKDPTNNSPKEWAKKAGYLTTETRPRPAPYNAKVSLPYSVTVLTTHGMNKLETILQKSALPPKPLALTAENAHRLQATPKSTAAQEEREKLLAEFNLPIYPAKAS
jgi:hypothetical protein